MLKMLEQKIRLLTSYYIHQKSKFYKQLLGFCMRMRVCMYDVQLSLVNNNEIMTPNK